MSMGRLWLAIRTFFAVLLNSSRAEQIRALETEPVQEPAPSPSTPQSAPKPAPASISSARSDALSLLEALQREARLLDFIQEDIDGYSDQQVGSAVREIHRGCRSVLQRMFDIAPVFSESEGEQITLQGGEEAARIRLTGHVVETRPVTGTLIHAGWRAQRCEIPKWNGPEEAALILAPAEVELAGG